MSDLENELNEQLNTAGQSVADGLDDEPEVIEPEEVEEIEEEFDPDEPEIDQPVVERPASRANARIQALSNEKKAKEAESVLLKQQNDLYRQQLEQLQRQQQNQQEENLDPDERWRQQANRAIQQVQFQAYEANDKTAFVSQVSKDPVLAKYADSVEKKLAEFRSQNINLPRDAVLTIVMGEAARSAASKVPAAKREGQARVSAARGQPLGTKSNVAPGKAAPTAFERLRDIPI